MTYAAFVAFFLKHWKWFAIGAVAALLALQSARLAHAKSDQYDRSACVAGQPCKPVKWKTEVARLRPALAAAEANLRTCRGNVAALQGSVDAQNAAVAALKADGERRARLLADELRQARSESASAARRADTILAARPKGPDVCAKLLDLDRTISSAG
jgi:hypothetical protein